MTPKEGTGEEATPSEFQEAGEAQLRAILDTIPARVAFIDRQRRHRYANPEYADLVGKPVGEIIGATVAETMGAATFERLRSLGERALAGETARWEGWVHYPRAGERYVQRIYAPYVAPSGAIDGYFVFVRDLTAVKQGERALAERLEALRASEAFNAAITASALDCIVVIDETGLVVEFNPAAEQTSSRPSCARSTSRACGAISTPASNACSVSASRSRRCAPTAAGCRSSWRSPRCGCPSGDSSPPICAT